MKEKAPKSNQGVANIANQENGIVTMLPAALDADVGEIDEEKVRQCIDDLCSIWSGIVVL